MYLLRCLDAKLTASEVVVFMEMWASPANGLKSVIFVGIRVQMILGGVSAILSMDL